MGRAFWLLEISIGRGLSGVLVAAELRIVLLVHYLIHLLAALGNVSAFPETSPLSFEVYPFICGIVLSFSDEIVLRPASVCLLIIEGLHFVVVCMVVSRFLLDWGLISAERF